MIKTKKFHIVLFSAFEAKLTTKFQDDYDISSVTNYNKLFKLIASESIELVIIDSTYVLSKIVTKFSKVQELALKSGIPIVIYNHETDEEQKLKLYTLDVMGLIDCNVGNAKQIVSNALYSAKTFINGTRKRCVSNLMRYTHTKDFVNSLLYYFIYLLKHYKIDRLTSLDLKFVFIMYAIAYKDNHLKEIKNIISEEFASDKLNTIMTNISKPTTLEEFIVAYTLDKAFDLGVDYSLIAPKYREQKELFYEQKNIYIASSRDIYHFWDKLNDLLLKNEYIPLHMIDSYLHEIFKIFYEILVLSHIFEAYIVQTRDKSFFTLHIHLKDDTTSEKIEQYIETYTEENSTIVIMKNYEVEDEYLIMMNMNDETESESKNLKVEKVVDTSGINAMHYEESEKVSAEDFLREFEVEPDLIDELNDNEREVKEILYFESDLSDVFLEAVGKFLKNYVSLLNSTIEFRDIAFSLESLYLVIEGITLESLADEKRTMLYTYFRGIIEDLSLWKEHIFITPNTPDIHYLDASLLENCSEIERFLLQDESDDAQISEDDEDDLEFF